MPSNWLLLDMSYLAWKSFHSVGHLSENGEKTGVVFGVVRDVLKLQNRFLLAGTVFCFDNGSSKRKLISPAYKYKDREFTEEEKLLRNEVYSQLDRVKDALLELGYRNLLIKPGYEADDMVAAAVRDLPDEDQATIVSSDHDLYQLISERVRVWHPTREEIVDLEALRARYGVTPQQWIKVKSIAGCPGDNVIGVDGVGEKTACKYLLGKLKEKSVARLAIEGSYNKIAFNRKLVELPYPGVEKLVLEKDTVSLEAWTKALRKLGFKSLRRLVL